MTQKSILITGCSSGIGYDAAHTLHKMGWRVFATCRAKADCERLIAEGLESFPLDYSDEASIKAALAECLDRTGGTLDALYNNGAYALTAFAADLTRDALRNIFETNFFGPFDLIHQVIPIMIKQGSGRIVNCSSVLGLVAMRGRGAYCSTKFAMEALSDAMRIEMHDLPIEIIQLEPGPISTKIRVNAQKPFEKWIDWENSAFRKSYETDLIPRLYDTSSSKDLGQLPASAVTQKLIKALGAKKPRAHYYVTTPTYVAAMMRRLLPTWLIDAIFRSR